MTQNLMTVFGVLGIHLSPGAEVRTQHHNTNSIENCTTPLGHIHCCYYYYYVALWLTILSCTEEEHVCLPRTKERNIKKAKLFVASEVERKKTFFESESSSSGISIEPPTPMKKL
uniref:Uncharacterized protein n=1 Tax=Solanum tuberosum TaxID=4113 RepID=M1ACV8_SOLTU